MLFQRAPRMSAAVVLVIVAVFGSTQSAVLRNTIEGRLDSAEIGDKNSDRRMQPFYEEISENEVNNSLPVLCLRKIFGQGECVDKFTATTRGDSSQKCKPNQVLMKGKCYEKLGSETSEEEETVKHEEKLPTICHRGSELVGYKCVDKLTTETRDSVSEKCKSGEVSIKGICFSLDEIASAESSEENFGNLPTVCLRGFELLGGKCVNKFGTDGPESNSSDSEDYNENDETAKLLNELFKTLSGTQNGGQTPEICLRGHVLIDGKCVDVFSLRNGIKSTEGPISKDIPSRIHLTEKEALPVICSRNSELIDGKCEDHFEPEELKMGCPLNYVKVGDKCIRRDFDPDLFVFPSELCAKDSTWNGEKCVPTKPRKKIQT